MRNFGNPSIPEYIQSFLHDPMGFLMSQNHSPFSVRQIGYIWTEFTKLSNNYSNLIILDKIGPQFNNLLIVGDIHGDLNSTLRIMRPFLEEKVDSMVFLGDYVDRGDFSFLNILYLICMAIVWPKRIILLRGNHEDLELNLKFGFYDEVSKYFPQRQECQAVLAILDSIYNLMSLVAITPQRSICLHAGIPKSVPRLEIVDQIPKPHKDYRNIQDEALKAKIEEAFLQIRWNDPASKILNNLDERSYHGYYYYTLTDTHLFLERNKMLRLYRSHEDPRGGYQEVFPNILYHIFSSEPYFGKIEMAFTIHEQPNGDIMLRDLDFNIQGKLNQRILRFSRSKT